jgi:WD domain, G-beta repeat
VKSIDASLVTCHLPLALSACLVVFAAPARCQTAITPARPSDPVFVSHGRVEGHLALNYSPAGAFSLDSRSLAVISGEKIALVDLPQGSVGKVLRPHLTDLIDLTMDSANFISPTRLFILGRGVVHAKGQPERGTPLLGFQWFIDQDSLIGSVDAVGASGGFSPILYLPHIGRVAMYKNSKITLWDPNSNRGGELVLAELAHRPGLFNFSPNGHWLVLARVEANGSPDPMVIDTRERKFADVLSGHHGSVLSVNFSRDGERVVTACEDGNVRVYSVGDWKLLHTLAGHMGPVHWAEFSPDGTLIASAGQDKTMRIWSAEDGRLLQTLEESREPLLTVAFSPDGSEVAATSEQAVMLWARQ